MTATLSKDKQQKLNSLKRSWTLYNEASSMIAHGSFSGYECESVFNVLMFLKELRDQLQKDIEALEPGAFEPANSSQSDEEVDTTDVAVGE